MSQSNKDLEKKLEKAFDAFWKLTVILFQVIGYGLKQVNLRSIEFKVYGLCLVGVAFGLTYRHRYVYWLEDLAPGTLTHWISSFLKSHPWPLHYVIVFIWLIFVALIFMGLKPYWERKTFQKETR